MREPEFIRIVRCAHACSEVHWRFFVTPALSLEDSALLLANCLCEKGFDAFFGTPCGILGSLYERMEADFGLRTVPREDNAVGIAAGASMAGRSPVVLMQNSGLGQSVNALASLVVPYEIPMLLIVSVRGVLPDQTQENVVMGRLTEPLLNQLGIATALLDPDQLREQVDWAGEIVRERRGPAALLVPPAFFGWRA